MRNRIKFMGIQWIALFIYLLTISVLEILSYHYEMASILASRIWLLMGAFLLTVFVYESVKEVNFSVKHNEIIGLVCFFAMCVLLLIYMCSPNLATLSFESPQQTGAAVKAFKNSDWNYTGRAFLGDRYPNRQYLLTAIPTMIFGRSVIALRAGFAYLFFIGMISVCLEFRAWLRKKEGADGKYALIAISLLFLSPILMEYYKIFEQTLIPVCLTMMCIASFLRFLRTNDVISLLAVSWAGCMLPYSYTPSFSPAGLLLVMLFLCLVGYWSKYCGLPALSAKSKAAVVLLLFNITVFLFYGLKLIKGTMEAHDTDAITIKGLIDVLVGFITDSDYAFWGILSLVAFAYMIYSLTGRGKFHNFLIAVWVFGTAFISQYLQGYIEYSNTGPILQRNMVVIPVVITAVFFLAYKHPTLFLHRISNPVVSIYFAAVLGVGLFNLSREYKAMPLINYSKPMHYLIEDAIETIPDMNISADDHFVLCVVTDNIVLRNIKDYATYFFPNAVCESYSSEEFTHLENNDGSIPFLIYSDQGISDKIDMEGREVAVPDFTWYKYIFCKSADESWGQVP